MSSSKPSSSPTPTQATAEARDVLREFSKMGFRLKAVVDTEHPGVEGHPIALHHLDRLIQESGREREREALERAAQVADGFAAKYRTDAPLSSRTVVEHSARACATEVAAAIRALGDRAEGQEAK